MPWHALRLVTAGIVTWAVAAFYTLRINPEVAFFVHGARVKQAWVERLNATSQPKTVVFGGSSCTVTVDGERMERQHQLPTVNLGLGAGMGAQMLAEYAKAGVRQGDTLIVALEPLLLTEHLEVPSLGVQFAWAVGDRALKKLARRDSASFTGFSMLLALRPGGYHVFTLLGKIAARQPLYRYAPSDFHASGWQEVTVQRAFTGPPERGPALTVEARALLQELRSWCESRGIRVAYALPWGSCTEAQKVTFQSANARFLRQVSDVLPVLKDARLGAYTERSEYADTFWHLTRPGAERRTDELAALIKAWSMWTPAELDRLADAPVSKAALP